MRKNCALLRPKHGRNIRSGQLNAREIQQPSFFYFQNILYPFFFSFFCLRVLGLFNFFFFSFYFLFLLPSPLLFPTPYRSRYQLPFRVPREREVMLRTRRPSRRRLARDAVVQISFLDHSTISLLVSLPHPSFPPPPSLSPLLFLLFKSLFHAIRLFKLWAIK